MTVERGLERNAARSGTRLGQLTFSCPDCEAEVIHGVRLKVNWLDALDYKPTGDPADRAVSTIRSVQLIELDLPLAHICRTFKERTYQEPTT